MKLAASIVVVMLVVAIASTFFYYDVLEHEIIAIADSNTGLKFTATCKYTDSSYQTYIAVRTRSNRLVSKQEIPRSADHLQDCLRQDYYVVAGIVPDPQYRKLIVTFKDPRRPPVEVPLALSGLDGVTLPPDPVSVR